MLRRDWAQRQAFREMRDQGASKSTGQSGQSGGDKPLLSGSKTRRRSREPAQETLGPASQALLGLTPTETPPRSSRPRRPVRRKPVPETIPETEVQDDAVSYGDGQTEHVPRDRESVASGKSSNPDTEFQRPTPATAQEPRHALTPRTPRSARTPKSAPARTVQDPKSRPFSVHSMLQQRRDARIACVVISTAWNVADLFVKCTKAQVRGQTTSAGTR